MAVFARRALVKRSMALQWQPTCFTGTDNWPAARSQYYAMAKRVLKNSTCIHLICVFFTSGVSRERKLATTGSCSKYVTNKVMIMRRGYFINIWLSYGRETARRLLYFRFTSSFIRKITKLHFEPPYGASAPCLKVLMQWNFVAKYYPESVSFIHKTAK